jgi:hypothetical protein
MAQMQNGIMHPMKEGMKLSRDDSRFSLPYLSGHLGFCGQFNFEPATEFSSQFVEKEIKLQEIEQSS